MNANKNRKYMEAIREMVNTKQGINVLDTLNKHGVPTYCRWSMNGLGWLENTRGRKSSSKWIGPKPMNETELLRLATILQTSVKDYNKRNKEHKKQSTKNVMVTPSDGDVSSMMAMDGVLRQQMASVVEKPRRTPRTKKLEVSVLWGMIKWTR